MAEGWADYGFPDDLTFRTAYLPYVGIVKAVYERIDAAGLGFEWPVPDFFSPIASLETITLPMMDYQISDLCGYFVNPDKVKPGLWRGYFWTYSELLQSVVDDPDELIPLFYDVKKLEPLNPEWPVKWALQRYRAINKLRYIPTVRQDYPNFQYEDLNDTFNFKEVSA